MVVGKRDGVEIKPSKQGAEPILKHFNLELKDILYVGDTKVDMKTATNIGVDSVGVLWGFRKMDELVENGAKVIAGLKRISKPGLRVYASKDELPRVLNGLGIALISTSKGIKTDKEARKENLGGEVLAYVW